MPATVHQSSSVSGSLQYGINVTLSDCILQNLDIQKAVDVVEVKNQESTVKSVTFVDSGKQEVSGECLWTADDGVGALVDTISIGSLVSGTIYITEVQDGMTNNDFRKQSFSAVAYSGLSTP